MTNEIISKISKGFTCTTCNYICSKNSEYAKHIATAKHIRLINPNKTLPEYPKIYICICGNKYKHNPSLYKHKKTCIEITNLNYKNKIIEELMKQNQELKELIIEQKEVIIEYKEEKQELKEVLLVQCEQSKYLIEITKEQTEIAKEQKYLAQDQAEEQTEHNKKVLELAQEQMQLAQEQNENQKLLMTQIKEKGLGGNITNNNHFNMNFFLNETCKDAMNIDDLYNIIRDFNLSHTLIEAFEKSNHVNGISNCMDAILDSVPMNKRPIHCSDLKREVMHIKQNDIWEKEKEVIEPLEVKLLRSFRGKCVDAVYKFQLAHMDIQNKDKDEDKYNLMLMHSCPSGNEMDLIKIKSRLAKKICIIREK